MIRLFFPWTGLPFLQMEKNFIIAGLIHGLGRWGEYVTSNNKYLFYSYDHGPEDCAIYWVRFDDLLEDLRHTNFEPYVKDSIANQPVKVKQPFSFKVTDNTFYDDDGNNTLSFSATSADGNALPAWLGFDVNRKILSGTPQHAGTYPVKIKAIDNAGGTAVCMFTITVE
jgi:hypothetical protein